MLVLRKVAVTGGLSSGKTEVCGFLREFGAQVISADDVVHDLLSSNPELQSQIVNLLGPDVLVNGQLDRKRIAQIVFHVPTLLRSLEKLIHPLVYEKIKLKYAETLSSQPSFPLFVAEIPLLFEGENSGWFDVTVAVVTPDSQAKKWYIENQINLGIGVNEAQDLYLLRSHQQLSSIEKARRADVVIMNLGTLEELRGIVREFYQSLIT